MGINILETILPGDKLEIFYINKQNEDLFLKTSVFDIISPTEILIQNPLKDGKVFLIPMGIEVNIKCLKDKFGVITFNAFLDYRKKVGNVYTISTKIVSEASKTQRRQYFRVNVYSDITLTYMEDKDGNQVDFYIFDPDVVEEEEKQLVADLLDVSGGGIGVKSKCKMELGTYVYFYFDLLTPSPELQGVVVRCFPSKDIEGEYEVGISFKDVPADIMRRITSYVFSKQQKIIRKERD